MEVPPEICRFKNMTKVTTGLKCAPEIGPSFDIVTYNVHPDAIKLASTAGAVFPCERSSAIIPDPIPVMTSRKVPRNSAVGSLHVIYLLFFVICALDPKGMRSIRSGKKHGVAQ